MISCPNKNTPEWERLVKEVGLEQALIMFNNQNMPKMFTEGLVTNDKSTVYTSEGDADIKLYGRTSNFMNLFFDVTNQRDAVTIADREFARLNKDTDTITRRVRMSDDTYITKEFGYKQYIEYLELIQEKKRQYGKFIHKLIELKGVLSYNDTINIHRLDIDPVQYQEGLQLYQNLKDRGKFTYEEGDIIHSEKTVSIDGFTLPFKSFDDKDIEVQGLAGTIDETIEHSDGSLSLRDFKTGALSSYVTGKMKREFADKNIPMTSINKAKLQIILYAVMMKINNPNLKFKKLEILKTNDYNSGEEVYYNAMEDMRLFLPVIKSFFDKNIPGYKVDKVVWEEAEYVAKNKSLQKRLEFHKDSASPFKEVKKELLRDLEVFQEKRLKAVDKLVKLEYEEKINEVLYQLDELENGYSTIKTGAYKQSMDFLSAFINDKDRVSNPLVQTFTRLFNESTVLLNQDRVEINRQFKQILLPVTTNNPNYQEAFSWFWDNGDIVTYNNVKWNELSIEQQQYADYYRWMIRFHLFKAMNPLVGIKIIQKELDSRTNWTLDKAILEEQIKELDDLCWMEGSRKKSINKLGYFKYYEGWTPRVTKTSEESDWKNLWNIQESFKLTEAEQKEIELAKADNVVSDRGIALMFMPENGTQGQNDGLYTFNPNVIFSNFINNAIKKQYLDDVVNVGNAISSFLSKQDEHTNSKFFQPTIAYINNILLAAVKQVDRKQLGTWKVAVKEKDPITGEYKETGEEITYSADRVAKAGKNMVSFTMMAFQPIASFRRGVSGTITYAINSIGNELAKFLGVKNTEFGIRDGYSAWVESWGLQISTKKEEKKLHLMSSMFGNLPDGYDGVGRSRDSFIKRADPYMFRRLNELGFSIDKIVDNANFNATMVAQLKAMKVESQDGKLISMWDAYEIKNNKLVYTGKPRGIDAKTKQLITGLTPLEINRLKALSKKMYGAYREEERIGLEASTLGALYMQFKKFAMPIYYAALAKSFENESLGSYIDSGEIDAEGNKILVWKGRPEEGFILSVLKAMKMTWRYKSAKRAWKELNEGQKRGIILAATKAGFFFVLGKLVAYAFGDDDDDDKNKIKQFANQIKRETATEFDVYATLKTITSLPTASKAAELIDGVYSLTIDSGLGGERIESGIFKNGYFGETIPPLKGIPQIMKNIPIGSSIWNAYRQSIDWNELAEEGRLPGIFTSQSDIATR